MHADIYVYDGGRYHEVVIDGETFCIEDKPPHSDVHPLDQLLADHGMTGKSRWRNGAPPGEYGDYSRGCWRHRRPVKASIDRPCCQPAADEIYTWWDKIRALQGA